MKKFGAIWISLGLAISLPAFANGGACGSITFEELTFAVCHIDPSEYEIELALYAADDKPIGTFDRLYEHLGAKAGDLVFATNGGMYHPDRRPVGLYIEDGEELKRIVTREGPGNFGLLPNGVLCLTEKSAQIVESREFADNRPDCAFATQSGPMLVIDGELHPRFLENSDSTFIRNGVGVTEGGDLVVAISDSPVNFHTFARLFRDTLSTPQALFMDGRISRIHIPELNRSDFGFPMGPILYAVKRSD
ncbi:MAG: phosphodiester glycosidase family protein [Boseongicola sp.]|nr:phosphodiester glycosidase family protein [Boseongicola sp.]MDD9976655.1 phosphodiester glycosidase family protein [Boseongicola sp.]